MALSRYNRPNFTAATLCNVNLKFNRGKPKRCDKLGGPSQECQWINKLYSSLRENILTI